MPTKTSKKKSPPTTKPAPAKPEALPDWLATLPDNLKEFGEAVHNERATCRKLLDDALEAYDDAVYDVVIDGTPKDVLTAMKKGRDSITEHADSILAIAASCAEDTIDTKTIFDIMREGFDDDIRNLGDLIGCVISEGRALEQAMLCQTLVRSLSLDARETLLGVLLP